MNNMNNMNNMNYDDMNYGKVNYDSINFDNDFIKTRSKNVKYTFVKPSSGDDYLPKTTPGDYTFFYQICAFSNPKNKKYHMRKFVVDENYKFVDIRDFYLSKKSYKKFFAEKKPHEYKTFPYYTLDDANYPHMTDILTAKSSMLDDSNNYTGFAPF